MSLLACGIPILECFYCLGCVRWAWQRCTHTGGHDSQTWGLASVEEFKPVPRLCRYILAVYEDDLDNPLWAPPGGYGIDTKFVVLRKTYEETKGQSLPYLIYIDHTNADIVLAIRGFNFSQESEYAMMLDNKLGKKKYDSGFVHNGLLKAAGWVLDTECEVLKELVINHPKYTLTFAGHSLGSGVAAMLAMLVVQNRDRLGDVERKRVRCFAIAAARCMSLDLAVTYADVINSVVLQDDFLPRTTSPLEDVFKSFFCLPCILFWSCLKDTCMPNRFKYKDSRRLYAPGRLYHIVERKPFRWKTFPPVVRTAVPVEERFEHIVLSCNATSDHSIIWIEREAQRALDLMLEKERSTEVPGSQKMERQASIVKEHNEEHQAAIRRAASLTVPDAYSPSTYGTFNESPTWDITQDSMGNMMVTGQWFYRPEEAEKKGGGSWQARDTRELFYSFHLDEVPAESVMHKCVVHFVPLNKRLPIRSQHPGFIVLRVYDTVERKLWKLTDKDYEDDKQHEIDLLVQKTRQRIGELPDIEPEEAWPDLEDNVKSKRPLRRKSIAPIDVPRNDESFKSEAAKAETPGSCINEASELYNILSNFKALTTETHRDKWLEKLMQGIQNVCTPKDNITPIEDKAAQDSSDDKNSESAKELPEGMKFLWPDDAVPAVTALERAAHQSLGSDFLKYNQKMRQLDFNLKNNRLLARRLLNKELEPSVILNMSPAELKDGITADEKTTKEPDRAEHVQMTDATCRGCHKKQAFVRDVIHAGGCGDRYELECMPCGKRWYSSRDAISSLTIETPNAATNVGTAPWATTKFEDVEKKLLSPHEPDKASAAAELFQKTTEPSIPVPEKQKSFSKAKVEDNHATTK